MVVARKLAPVLLTLAALVLAGCAGGGEPDAQAGGQAPPVEATATTGGIRGVVVDDRITPIKGAFVEVVGVGKNLTTLDDGIFVFSGLEPGAYTVKASHGLYAPAQQTTEVVAGESEPRAVKIQLIRTVFAEPYLETYKYDGFIVCSVNTIGLLSEECGEGVGVPGMGRVGGQANNNVQFDVSITSADIKSIVFEKAWEATSDAGRELFTPIGTEWVCDPSCSWDEFGEMNGPSPQYLYAGPDLFGEGSAVKPGAVLTMFTWAGSFEDPAGVAINQQYQDFMTISYYLPLPEGWSFIGGSANPFT